jgi:hypothetical protein
MVDLNNQLRLHEKCRVRVERLGAEGIALVVVDDFLSNPQILIDYAAACGRFEGVSDTFYPGARSPAPPIYCFAVRAFLQEALNSAFGLESCRVTGELSHFSLVTTPPERLSLPQRLPHFDNTNPKQIAVLHYLHRPEYGGTSFYRHRRTGYEYIDAPRQQNYARALQEDFKLLGEPPRRYILGDDERFERIGGAAADFNRLIAYRSISLHSADIAPDFVGSLDPHRGRLTVNTFFFYS